MEVVRAGLSEYRVVWAKDRRMVKLCEKMLNGLSVNHRSGRYYYALFCQGQGFAVRRKDSSISAQEQSWTDVCVVAPLRFGGAGEARKENAMYENIGCL